MKEVRIIPSPNMELCIRISEQMERDFRICQMHAERRGHWPECSECSWRDLALRNGGQSIAACELPKVRKAVMGGRA